MGSSKQTRIEELLNIVTYISVKKNMYYYAFADSPVHAHANQMRNTLKNSEETFPQNSAPIRVSPTISNFTAQDFLFFFYIVKYTKY